MSAICDHIIPRLQRPDLALRISNIQLLHARCHAIKTHSTERTNKVQVNDDGLPSDGSWG
jgi:5-methylcytosine-specific restriction endonuclease McrA